MADIPLISRSEAQKRGLLLYFTGKPCKNGHIDFRYTSKGMCVTCTKQKSMLWIRENPEANRHKSASNYSRHRDTIASRRKQKRDLIPADIRCSEYRERYTRRRDAHIAAVRRWKLNNPVRARILRQNHRALKNAAPGSYTTDDLNDILINQNGLCVGCGKDITHFHAYRLDTQRHLM